MSVKGKLSAAIGIAAASAVLFLAFAGSRASAVADGQQAAARAGQVDLKRLIAADKRPGEWLTQGRDFGKGHYSPLAQINTTNVGRLGFAWQYDTNTIRGLEATPIVVDGVMYTSGSIGQVYALDAKTGKEIWTYDPHNDMRVNQRACCDEVNRGVAVWRGKVYVASFDGHMIALDAATGRELWRADTVIDKKKAYTSTGAPQIAGKVVVIGNAGAEYDARGYVSAYDLDTGKLAWRFFTVPGDPSKPQENPELDVALKTWDPKSNWPMGGGGTVWGDMAYDPDLDLVYFGTGNGTYYDQSKRSPAGGDNLYIASILAIHADTGRLAWYYQEAPGDAWDYDATQPIILTDLKIGGTNRKVLMQAAKTGFFYVLDRKTGQVLSAEKFVPVTWADDVDLKTGRPVFAPGVHEFKNNFNGKVYLHPGSMGGHNWDPMSYDSKTGLVYIPEIENDDAGPFSGKTYLRAWDPIRGKHVWETPASYWWDHAGVLSTAGGLVFQGNGPGHMIVYDAATGKPLKDINVGSTIMAAPMSYEIDGVQYVAVMAAWGGGGWSWVHPEDAAYQRGNEGRIIVFKLDGGAVPIPPLLPPIQPIPQPPALTASADVVKQGGAVFGAHCASCHVNQPGSLAPDLRRMSKETHDGFKQIVLGGVLGNAGMPPWDDVLSSEDADAIHAYLISISWDAYNKQQQETPRN
ncbi:MAG TPA: PQQ-binding-like beta-propeller repeat protein [Candidatus Acidoferrum sp.]|nr:PQQ-binding-like beta-propeller repeat protein [Candidatus Acidoferrum sp.]